MHPARCDVVDTDVRTASAAIIEEHLRWERVAGRSASTIIKRRAVLRRLAGQLPVPLDQAKVAHLAAWQTSLAGLSTQSVATYVGHVRTFYGWLVRHERRSDDPSRVLVRPRVPRRLPRPAEEEDLHLALTAGDARMRAIMALMAFAGLRCMEVAGIDRADVHDSADPPYLLVHGKGCKERVVPLTERTVAALREYGLPVAGWVFRADCGQAMTANHVSQLVSRHVRSLGLRFTAHQLRHYFGTTAHEESGANLRLVQELMGHESPATTAIYTQVTPRRCEELLEALDRHAADVLT